MSLPLCQILAFQPARHLLYLVNLETKQQLANIVFDLEIHTYELLYLDKTLLTKTEREILWASVVANLLLLQTVEPEQDPSNKNEIKRQHRSRHVFLAHDARARPITADLICLHLHLESLMGTCDSGTN